MNEERQGLDELADELRLALGDDPPPLAVLAAAGRTWDWRLIDAELAELVEEERAVLRSDHDLLTFAADEVFIDVDLAATGPGTARFTGQVTAPVTVTSVLMELADGSARTVVAELDAQGAFRADVSDSLRARVVVELAGGRRVVSPWLSL